jgi:arginyl-tRNA synthetase
VIRDLIQKRVAEAVARLAPAKAPPVEVDIQDPRDSSHGDFACSYALAAAKGFGLSPRDLAEKIKNELLTNDSAAENDERRTTNDESSTGNESETVGGESETVGGESETVGGESETVGGIASPLGGEAGERSEPGGGASNSSHVARPISRLFASIEVAGPGFLNFRVTDEAWLASVTWANERAADLPKPQDCNTARPQLRLNVEFVSVNPNGPITVGSGRGAAFGSTLCNVLEAAGHEVHREYYINDGTNSEQMRLFAESVISHLDGTPLPEGGYRGDYVKEVADRIQQFSPIFQLLGRPVPANQLKEDPEFPYPKQLTGVRAIAGKRLGLDKLDPWEEPVVKLALAIASEAVSGSFDHVELETAERHIRVLLGREGLMHEVMTAPLSLRKEFFQVFAKRMESVEVGEWRCFQLRSTEDDSLPKNLSHMFFVRGDAERQVWEILPSSMIGASNRLETVRAISESLMVSRQRGDLAAFSTTFNTWFSEESLHNSGKVEENVQDLVAKGSADDQPIRRVLKLAKGGKIEDVEIVEQPNEDAEEGMPNDAADAASLAADNPSQATLWLRSTKFGDDMDRVLRRKDGRLTYIASDVAYHKDKFNRPENADKLITILGPDHHGYIGRLHAVVAALLEKAEDPDASAKAKDRSLDEIEAKIYDSPEERDLCLEALGESKKRLEVIIFQIVRFVKDGKPAPMRKRDGNIYSLRDLMTEIGKDAAPNAAPEDQLRIGKDVARFFYLMRSHDTHMDFDIDLATKGTEENPVFYVQYAHARICSILRKSQEIDDLRLTIDDSPSAYSPTASESGSPTLHPKETALIKKILDLPEEVRRCAEDYGVHRLTTYAIELARAFHHFYDACRVIQPENPALSRRRLALCEATRHALRGALALLGVSAPERMEREGPPPCFERSEK